MSNAYRLTQTVIMGALALYLAEKLWSGAVFFYINERFLPLIAFGAAAALALAVGAAWLWRRGPEAGAHEHDHDHDHEHDHDHPAPGGRQRFPVWTVALVALPVVLGVLIPARPLGASAVDNRGLNTTGPVTAASGSAVATLEIAPTDRSILDWIRAYNYAEDPAEYTGQSADVIGFVYHDEQLGAARFMVGRFTVTCCAADAAAVAMMVEWPDAGQLAENTWVRVRGPVRVAELNGRPIPLITAALVETVPQPDQPYMYP